MKDSGDWEALGWVASRVTKPWPTQSSEGRTHCDVDLDGLALLEAQVQFGAFVWVLGLFCKLTLLFHPPGEGQEKRGEAGTAATLPSHTRPPVQEACAEATFPTSSPDASSETLSSCTDISSLISTML